MGRLLRPVALAALCSFDIVELAQLPGHCCLARVPNDRVANKLPSLSLLFEGRENAAQPREYLFENGLPGLVDYLAVRSLRILQVQETLLLEQFLRVYHWPISLISIIISDIAFFHPA